MNEIQIALDALNPIALSEALDAVLTFSTVLGDEDSVRIGDHMVWVDSQDAANVGWCWRRTFVDGAASGEDATFDTARELVLLMRGAGYEVVLHRRAEESARLPYNPGIRRQIWIAIMDGEDGFEVIPCASETVARELTETWVLEVLALDPDCVVKNRTVTYQGRTLTAEEALIEYNEGRGIGKYNRHCYFDVRGPLEVNE